MPSDTKVTIYYGPLSWLHEQLGGKKRKFLLDVVNELDEGRRRIIHQVEGQPAPEDKGALPRPKRIVTESADYASVQEHAVMNFVGLIRSINPEHLVLHNPPAHIHTQLEREFSTEVKRYSYPGVTIETLTRFRDRFGEHLIGQDAAKALLLAALYPLTSERRTKPMVLMFYGPSGVGKTETAQFINGLLGGILMRKQFSMYHNDKFASYLFGGSHSEASFARDLLDRESRVILIDEFDKANPVFHSAFYELFDGGVFEDKNYRVEVGPSLIICTSNYASEDEIRKALGEALYSRFDFLVAFRPLSKVEVHKVIERLVNIRFSKLTPDERDRLDAESISSALFPLADQSGNIRYLGKNVDQAISHLLVSSILDGGQG